MIHNMLVDIIGDGSYGRLDCWISNQIFKIMLSEGSNYGFPPFFYVHNHGGLVASNGRAHSRIISLMAPVLVQAGIRPDTGW